MKLKQLFYVPSVAALTAFTAAAHAAVPGEVISALDDAKTDSIQIAGLALVIIIAIAAFKYMRRAV